MMMHDSESQHPVATFVATNVSREFIASFFSVQHTSSSCLATVTRLRLITKDHTRIKTVLAQSKSRIEENFYQ
jgi:hypothetical protein